MAKLHHTLGLFSLPFGLMALACTNDVISATSSTDSSSGATSSSSQTETGGGSASESAGDGDGDGGDGDGDGDQPSDPIAPQGTNVLVRVFSGGQPVEGALLTVGEEDMLTDGAGFALLEDLAEGLFVCQVKASGYTPASIALELAEDSAAYWEVELLPLSEPIVFDAQTEATLEQDGFKVSIPGNRLVDANGQKAIGEVEVTITPLDPLATPGAIPGRLIGMTTDAEAVPLQSAAMAEISFSQAGEPLQLADGATATLEFPLSPDLDYQAGDLIPSWSLNLETGVWDEELMGTVMVDPDDPQSLVWQVPVTHFTWWNTDKKVNYDDLQCFIVNVFQDGQPVNRSFMVSATTTPQQYQYGMLTDGGSSNGTYINNKTNCFHALHDTMPTLTVSGVPNFQQPITQLDNVTTSHCIDPWTWPQNGPANPNCTQVPVVLPPTGNPIVCDVNSYIECNNYPHMTYPNTENVGVCRGGRVYCVDGTSWQPSTCATAESITPAVVEICYNNADENCNGSTIDYGAGCECNSVEDEDQSCYLEDEDFTENGDCMTGTQVCVDTQWTDCDGAVYPGVEICGPNDMNDENCDGVVGCQGAELWSTHVDVGGQTGTARSVFVNNEDGLVLTAGYFSTSAEVDNIDYDVATTALFDSFVTIQNVGDGTLSEHKILLSSGANPPPAQDSGRSLAFAVTADGNGNVIVAGVYYGTLDVDGPDGALTSTLEGPDDYSGDIFVVKFDSNLTTLWAQTFGGPGYDAANAVVTTINNEIIVTGTVDVSAGNVLPNVQGVGGSDVFLLKLAENGDVLWGGQYGGGTPDIGNALAVGPDGELVLGGYFSQSIDFGLGSLVSAGGTDGFVTKLTPMVNGYTEVWSRRLGGSGPEAVNDVALNTMTGDVFAVGRYTTESTLGSALAPSILSVEPCVNDGSENFFVLGLDTMGTHLGSHGWVGSQGVTDTAMSVAVDINNQVVFTGRFTGTIEFGDWVMNSQGPASDIIVVKYDVLNDTTFWAQRFGNTDHDVGFAVDVNNDGVYVGGQFVGNTSFGGEQLQNMAGQDPFLVSFKP